MCTSCCTFGWSVDIFLISQNRSTKQRSGMILEVQIQIFGTRAPLHACQSFHFQKIPWGQNINIIFKMGFLTVNNFFVCVFKNTNQNNICASCLLKLNQSRNTKKKFFRVVLLKSQISNLYFCDCSLIKKEASSQF